MDTHLMTDQPPTCPKCGARVDIIEGIETSKQVCECPQCKYRYALEADDAEAERVKLTPEQLDALMPPGEAVHTIMQAGPVLLGANWPRADILERARAERGAELSGPEATAMKHGAIIWNEDGTPVFVETIPTVPTK